MKVVFKDMPNRINGLTVRTYDEGEYFYTIILNARLSYEQQKNAYNHELSHIRRNDFDSVLSIDQIEKEVCVV